MTGVVAALAAAFATSAGSVESPFPVTALSETDTYSTAAAGFTVNTDGTYSTAGDSSSPASGNWYSPTTVGIGSSYWIRVSLNSGTAPSSGATGSWLAMSSARTWTWSRSATGTATANITIEIASDAAGTNVVSTRSLSVSITVNDGLAPNLGYMAIVPNGTVASPVDASVIVNFYRDGTWTFSGTQPLQGGTNGNYYGPTRTSTTGDSFWVRITINSGQGAYSGTTGSWLQLNTTRTWEFRRTGAGTNFYNITIEVASTSGGGAPLETPGANSFQLTVT